MVEAVVGNGRGGGGGMVEAVVGDGRGVGGRMVEAVVGGWQRRWWGGW